MKKINKTYNPDVLNCIANLSNDEVFTPPALANKMLDTLPQSLFSNPDVKFLDPFCKSGVFLREIVKRLNRGLASQMPDVEKRINHILKKQVYGIAITELTSLLSRRTVYCSKVANGPQSVANFTDTDGNIYYKPMQHTWVGGKCKYCGASQSVYERTAEAETYAYNFIHVENINQIFNMKFDVIIGNPPYQLSDGGGMKTDSSSGSAIPLYHRFVYQAKKLNPKYLCMIIPSRWFSGGRGLDEFRNEMLNDKRLTYLYDFESSKDCFPGVDIAGGICYFLWERDRKDDCIIINNYRGKCTESKRSLSEYPVFIRFAVAVDIIKKVTKMSDKMMNDVAYSSNPFGFRSFEKGRNYMENGDIKLLGSDGVSYVNPADVKMNNDVIGKWKVVMSKASAEHAGQTDNEGRKKIVSRIEVLPPNIISTETYLLLMCFDEKHEAENLKSYVQTRFFRFLMSTILLTQNIAKDKFQFVPLQDFSHPWTDKMLYEKYKLDDKEIDFIESMIKPME